MLFHLQMAMQEASPATTPSAQVVGNAFVEQYYHILHESPNLVHRFYQDSSFLSRPDGNGVMTTVTTMQVSLQSHACMISYILNGYQNRVVLIFIKDMNKPNAIRSLLSF